MRKNKGEVDMPITALIPLLIILLPAVSGLVFLSIQMIFDLRGEQKRCPICNGTRVGPLIPGDELRLCHRHYWRLQQIQRDER